MLIPWAIILNGPLFPFSGTSYPLGTGLFALSLEPFAQVSIYKFLTNFHS